MPDAAESGSLITVVCRLREFVQQRCIVEQRLESLASDDAAAVVHDVLSSALHGNQKARRAALPVSLWLAHLHDPGHASRRGKLEAHARARDFSLLAMILRAGPAVAELPRKARLPEVGLSSTTSVSVPYGAWFSSPAQAARYPWVAHEIRRRCRHEDPAYIERLLAHADYLSESDILRIASRRPTTPAHLGVIRQSQWVKLQTVRNALVANPFTPGGVAASLLPTASIATIRHAALLGGPVLEPLAEVILCARDDTASNPKTSHATPDPS
ncbi:MAG: hypothetical protein AAGF12_34520 [Myxococcota bacterium]